MCYIHRFWLKTGLSFILFFTGLVGYLFSRAKSMPENVTTAHHPKTKGQGTATHAGAHDFCPRLGRKHLFDCTTLITEGVGVVFMERKS